MLLHAWQLWALSSELALVITHLKVLLCIGKPIGEQQLSDKRCSYFVYDFFSPWLSLFSLLAAPSRRRHFTRQLLAAAAAAAVLSSGPATSSTGGGVTPAATTAAAVRRHDDSTDGAAAGGPLVLLLQGQVCNATAASSSSSSSCCCPAVAPALQAPASDAAAGTTAPTAAPPSLPAAAVASMQLPQGGDGSQQPLLPLALPPLLLLMAGHAALHVFYILAWHRPAARNVLRLSAVGSMSARFKPGQAWRRWEAVWFLAGTSADVATHLVLAGLLLGELLLPTAA